MCNLQLHLYIVGSTHSLHSKSALGQDVGQMLWHGAPEHVRGACPCLQTDPVALPETGVLSIYGSGGTGDWEPIQQTGLILFYPCLPGNVGLVKVEWELLGTEEPHWNPPGPHFRDTSILSPCPRNLTLLIPGEMRQYFNPMPGCKVLCALA